MDAKQSLYYGLGQVSYAVAMSDGAVQEEEQLKLKEVLKSELDKRNLDADYADIIFELLKRDQLDGKTAYENGIKAMSLGSHYLTDDLREKFSSLIKDVADAFPPTTSEEQACIDRFDDDLKKM